MVSQIFSDVSDKYDIMNDLMSFGLHRIWKNNLVDLIKLSPEKVILDLATGSGDIIKIIKKRSECLCLGYDSNLDMINEAKKKNLKNAFFVCGKSEEMPFSKNTFDYVIVSFGLRNFSDMDKSLKEVFRILKPSGKFLCLEFSQINNPLLSKLFNIYNKIIPKYGKFLSKNELAYKYLIKSIEIFPNQIKLSKKLLKSGFRKIEVFDIIDGLSSIHIAKK